MNGFGKLLGNLMPPHKLIVTVLNDKQPEIHITDFI